jgi:small subunit ribosomal protein S1
MDPLQLEEGGENAPERPVEQTPSMDALLETQEFDLETPRRGEIRTGTIARISDGDILVDIGAKSEGLIPAREVEQLSEERREAMTVGSQLGVYIVRLGGADSITVLSIARAEEEHDWGEAERLLNSQEPLYASVAGYNKGGLIVKLGQLRGFVPASQVSLSRRRRAEGESPDKRWGKMVGEPIVVKVVELDRRRNRLILSERAAAKEARKMLKEQLIVELQPGDVREGHVISLADFGAFVDIGGADGLVHLSEISWKRISHPKDVLSVGQQVQVQVLSVDPDRKRISLSLRELEPDPWESVTAQLVEGQLVEGTITKLTKFGAFASLKGFEGYDIEGLIHISELSDRRIEHPREVVQEGDTMPLRVIRIDTERRRIGLSLKRVDSAEYADIDWQTAMQAAEVQAAEVQTAEVQTAGAEPTAPATEDFDAELEAVEALEDAGEPGEPDDDLQFIDVAPSETGEAEEPGDDDVQFIDEAPSETDEPIGDDEAFAVAPPVEDDTPSE